MVAPSAVRKVNFRARRRFYLPENNWNPMSASLGEQRRCLSTSVPSFSERHSPLRNGEDATYRARAQSALCFSGHSDAPPPPSPGAFRQPWMIVRTEPGLLPNLSSISFLKIRQFHYPTPLQDGISDSLAPLSSPSSHVTVVIRTIFILMSRFLFWTIQLPTSDMIPIRHITYFIDVGSWLALICNGIFPNSPLGFPT